MSPTALGMIYLTVGIVFTVLTGMIIIEDRTTNERLEKTIDRIMNIVGCVVVGTLTLGLITVGIFFIIWGKQLFSS